MTDQSISSTEFQRFQDQLISLKEAKYRTEEKCESLNRSLVQMQTKCFQLERELQKANELKQKFRSARDIEALMNENDVLRDRLSGIESNFKLQNDVVKAECELLLSENERLKSQLETLKSSRSNIEDETENKKMPSDADSSETEDDHYRIRQLQFEITKLLSEKEQVTNECKCQQLEIMRLKGKEEELINRVDLLLTEKYKLSADIIVVREELRILDEDWRTNKESLENNHKMELEKLQNENKQQIENMQISFDEDKTKQIVLMKELHLSDVDRLKGEWNKCAIDYENEIDELTKQILDHKDQFTRTIDQCFKEKELMQKENAEKLQEITDVSNVTINDLNDRIVKLQDELNFKQEELKIISKKNEKLLKDIKKQLEKEVRMSQEAQSKLVEATSNTSLNSQSRDFYYSSGQLYSIADDRSSIYSSSNNGVLSDSQANSVNSIPVTDDELKNLLDRMTNIQNENCECKRQVEIVNNEKSKLIKTIEKQQRIILNYIKNRSGNDADSLPDSPEKANHSTSEALTLNGILSSPEHSNFGLNILLNKVKETVKSMSSKDFMSMNGDKMNSRVTVAEVRQLQRVCEELMMRCLNLETDLQTALDLNVKLNSQLQEHVLLSNR